MQYSLLPELNHDLVVLRPIARTDLPAWYGYLSLPAVFERTSWNVQSPTDLESYLSQDSPTPSSRLRLAIAARATDELIGTAGFHTVSAPNRSAEMAYDLSPSYWGKGIATQVCSALVQWAHLRAGIVRVQATTVASNVPSQRVLQRCGSEREGLLKSYRMVRGNPGDFWMYAHVATTSGERL